ncbi:MAG: transposase [Holosporaceae bacterium]|nr:transposase [Holosporaceae bacterium]
MLEWTKSLKSTDIPVFCMEATGCYHELLAEHLYNCGSKVCVINPLLIKRFRESQMIRTKTDKSDSLDLLHKLNFR